MKKIIISSILVFSSLYSFAQFDTTSTIAQGTKKSTADLILGKWKMGKTMLVFADGKETMYWDYFIVRQRPYSITNGCISSDNLTYTGSYLSIGGEDACYLVTIINSTLDIQDMRGSGASITFTRSYEDDSKIPKVTKICNPKKYDAKVLDAPNAPSIHPDWIDSHLGTDCTFRVTKEILTTFGTFYKGNLMTNHGGYFEGGPFYIMATEWTCEAK